MPKAEVILFCFAGRRDNMKLQMPFYQRILRDHPEVEIHLWDLTKNARDRYYLSTLGTDRITVMTEFQNQRLPSWTRFNGVYKHYTSPEYCGCLFVKLDDDVVFIETGRFDTFLDTIRDNPEAFITAKVINNGACTRVEPPLWAAFEKFRINLLDVHLSTGYFVLCHDYFYEHWNDLVGQEPKAIPTDDWLSINMIGYNWQMGCELTNMLGTHPPHVIAGRSFDPQDIVGDEGAVNMFPRVICQGFLACHFTFGPQERRVRHTALPPMRARYAEIGAKYLNE